MLVSQYVSSLYVQNSWPGYILGMYETDPTKVDQTVEGTTNIAQSF